MNTLPKILRHIDPNRIKNLLVEAVDQYSPSFAEIPAMRVFAEALDEAGIPYYRQSVPSPLSNSNRGNLVVGLGPTDDIALLWVGHLDTIELWHDEGHQARIAGDALYGLGAADMKGGCVAMVEALYAIVQSGVQLRRGLGVALVVGEEEYGDGSIALNEEIQAPLTIIGEPTGLIPCPTHASYLECRLIGKGLRAHAAFPEAGANAIHAMLAWMLKIIEECQHLLFSEHLAVNPREIHGGEPGFVVAESCEAMIDFHLPPNVNIQSIERVIEKAKQSVLKDHKDIELTYEQIHWSPGFAVDENDHHLIPLKRAFEACDLKWHPSTFRSHSDANIFYRNGTLPIVCGPGNLSVAHQREEYVSLKEVEKAAQLYATMIYEICVK